MIRPSTAKGAQFFSWVLKALKFPPIDTICGVNILNGVNMIHRCRRSCGHKALKTTNVSSIFPICKRSSPTCNMRGSSADIFAPMNRIGASDDDVVNPIDNTSRGES